MADKKLTAEELQWQAESDARAMARSKDVHEDPTRLSRAKNAAGELAKDAVEEAQDLKEVSSNLNKISGNPSPAVGGGSILDVFKKKE